MVGELKYNGDIQNLKCSGMRWQKIQIALVGGPKNIQSSSTYIKESGAFEMD